MTDSLPSRDRPWPAGWTVERGLSAFLHENGYRRKDYDAPRTPAAIGPVRFWVPNPPRHRRAIMRHDLHHIAAGYGTDLRGEAEMSAWELRRGVRPVGVYVGFLVVGLALLGLVVAPIRTAGAWRAPGTRASLFHRDDLTYDALLAMRIGELRAVLGIPEEGLATRPRRSHSRAPRPDAEDTDRG